MASRGYDVVVDVDADGSDLAHTDLAEDGLEFHNSTFTNPSNTTGGGGGGGTTRGKLPPNNSSFLPTSTGIGGGGVGGGGGTSIGGTSNKHYLWTLSFYSQFFDVDTAEVLRRCLAALFPRANFLDVLDGNPDLYGPFWIATTVVAILFLTGTVSAYLASTGREHYRYDFSLLSGAAGLVYGYTLFVPVGLWAVLRYFGGSEGASVLECWALYGYANLIWIPVAMVSWSPLTALNLAFVAVGFGISAVFLFRNLWPVLSATDQKTSRVLLIVVLALHAGLAIAIKILFFAHGSPAAKDKGDGGGAKGGTDDDKTNMLIRLLFGR